MRLCVCVITSPGEPDYARGLLELLRAVQPELDYGLLTHVHGLSVSEYADGYLADQELRLPARSGERGRCDRLNAAAELASASGADYGLFIESDVWPLKPRLLAVYVRRMALRGGLLGAAAMGRTGKSEPPVGGLWPRVLTVDLAWQRARRLFPLDWERYEDAVMLRSDHWEAPRLSGCLSAHYFRRIADTVTPEAARASALTQLLRFEELEPVTWGGLDEQWTWHAIALVREARPAQRGELVRRLHAEGYGPTIRALADSGGVGWFNTAHEHPRHPSALAASAGRRHRALPVT